MRVRPKEGENQWTHARGSTAWTREPRLRAVLLMDPGLFAYDSPPCVRETRSCERWQLDHTMSDRIGRGHCPATLAASAGGIRPLLHAAH